MHITTYDESTFIAKLKPKKKPILIALYWSEFLFKIFLRMSDKLFWR